jgi:hypothetical protein
LEVGLIMIPHRDFRDHVAHAGTDGGRFANCSWHLRTALEIANESCQARRLLGGEIESLLFARRPFSKMKSETSVMIGKDDHEIPAVEPRARS